MSAITTELLDALLSAGPQREQAETHLSSLSTVDRTQGFISILFSLSNQGHVLLGAVLLRRNVAQLAGDVLAHKLDGPSALTLLQELVEPLSTLFLNTEQMSAPCRRQLGHCLAEVGSSLSILDPTTCDVVLTSVLERIAPLCLKADAVSLHCLAILCDRGAASLCRSGAIQRLPFLFQSASSCVSDETAVEALVQAICNAAIATEASHNQDEELIIYPASPSAQLGQTLLPILNKHVQKMNTDSLTRCLQHLAHAANTCPSLLAGDLSVLSALVQTCLTITGDARLASLQVLSSLCAVRAVQRQILNVPGAGANLRTTLLQGVINLCAQAVVEGVEDDVEGWASEAATLWQDVDDDEEAPYAESLLGSFLHDLGGGQQSLPVVLPLVERLLAAGDWKSQRAALSVLEQCLYAAPVTFSQHLPVALETALSLSSTQNNARVQYQALTLLGALCDEDKDECSLRQHHGGRILKVAARLVASPYSKVSSIASAMIVSYCRGGGASAVEKRALVVPFARDVLLALVTGPLSAQVVQGAVVDSGSLVSQVKAIGAVACLSEACDEEFVPYYADVMPGLFGIVQTIANGNNQEVSQLRGAAIESMTIVGQSIGEENREVYVADAEKIMQIAIPVLKMPTDTPFIPMDQVLSACARIATVMGEHYTPFVDQVLPHLLDRVTAQVDIFYEEGSEAGLEPTKRGDAEIDDDGNETMTLSVPGKGLTKVSINVAKIEEKAQACRAIYEHATALGASFGPYAGATLAALMPLVSFTYSSEVRSTASQAAAAVFDSACQAGLPVAQEYLPILSSAMCKQIYAEGSVDMEVLYALCEALSDTLYFAYKTITVEDRSVTAKVTVDNGNEIVQLLMKLISSCLQRRAKIFQTLQGIHGALSGEDEENELTQALESEQEILTPLVDSVGYTLKFLKEQFTPIFDLHVAPVLAPYLNISPDTRARFAATALFDDCVEHCGPVAAQKYGPLLVEGAMIGINDSTSGGDEGVKQVSLYGISQISRKCSPSVLEPHAQTLIGTLLPLASASKEDSENLFIVENAVSALASLTIFGKAPPLGHLKFLNKETIVSTLLRQLPLREDEDEAKFCHAAFCDLILEGQIHPATESVSVLRIIGETLSFINDGEDLASSETQSNFATILYKMQRDVPAGVMKQAYESLSEEAQGSVNKIVQQYAQQVSNVVTP